MEEAARSPLLAWESFYVIVGSSGAALTGLQFVVIAIVAESKRRSSAREIDAFGTPTVVHFSTVLLVSSILSAPWQVLSNTALALGGCGLAGVIYGAVILRRARRVSTYRPVLEDWFWHIVFPLVAYASLLVAAVLYPSHPQRILFLVGATVLFLLIVGIHNAWDTVTYITVGDSQGSKESEESTEPE